MEVIWGWMCSCIKMVAPIKNGVLATKGMDYDSDSSPMNLKSHILLVLPHVYVCFLLGYFTFCLIAAFLSLLELLLLWTC